LGDDALRIIDSLLENDVQGLVPGGRTGEFAALSISERKRLHEITLEHTGGQRVMDWSASPAPTS
jgi:dihydrodipicolinate synthase/N-acetylneuraminate lyase